MFSVKLSPDSSEWRWTQTFSVWFLQKHFSNFTDDRGFAPFFTFSFWSWTKTRLSVSVWVWLKLSFLLSVFSLKLVLSDFFSVPWMSSPSVPFLSLFQFFPFSLLIHVYFPFSHITSSSSDPSCEDRSRGNSQAAVPSLRLSNPLPK